MQCSFLCYTIDVPFPLPIKKCEAIVEFCFLGYSKLHTIPLRREDTGHGQAEYTCKMHVCINKGFVTQWTYTRQMPLDHMHNLNAI